MTWSEARAEAATMVLNEIAWVELSHPNHDDDPEAKSKVHDEIDKIRTWLHHRILYSTKEISSLTKKAV